MGMGPIPDLHFTGGAATGGWADSHATVVVGGGGGTPFERMLFATQGSEYNLGTTPDVFGANTISRATGLPKWVPWVGGAMLVLIGGIVVWKRYAK